MAQLNKQVDPENFRYDLIDYTIKATNIKIKFGEIDTIQIITGILSTTITIKYLGYKDIQTHTIKHY